MRPTAAVYVDGFNLFRRVLSGRPHLKWLDLELLCDAFLPSFEVVQIRYFTAIVKAVAGGDTRSPARQAVYLRALATLPRVSLHFGEFRVDKRWMARSPIDLKSDGEPQLVRVRKIEEKGTDVGLAAHMVADAMSGLADAYFLMSNDSDFVEALRVVRHRARAEIGLISPPGGGPAKALLDLEPDHPRQLRHGVLLHAQFPDALIDERGTIRRPAAWGNAEAPLVSGASQPVAEASGVRRPP